MARKMFAIYINVMGLNNHEAKKRLKKTAKAMKKVARKRDRWIIIPAERTDIVVF